MLKSYRVIKSVGDAVRDASQSVADRVIGLHRDPKGHEEEITSQLRSEITLHLLEEIQKRLDNHVVNSVRFQVYVYKKKEEKETGADIAGILEMNIEGEKVVKAYLAQAKVGQVGRNKFNEQIVKCNDTRVLGQVRNMLRLTSSAYVFLYSSQGVDVISANAVRLANSHTISTELFYTHKFSDFYSFGA